MIFNIIHVQLIMSKVCLEHANFIKKSATYLDNKKIRMYEDEMFPLLEQW